MAARHRGELFMNLQCSPLAVGICFPAVAPAGLQGRAPLGLISRELERVGDMSWTHICSCSFLDNTFAATPFLSILAKTFYKKSDKKSVNPIRFRAGRTQQGPEKSSSSVAASQGTPRHELRLWKRCRSGTAICARLSICSQRPPCLLGTSKLPTSSLLPICSLCYHDCLPNSLTLF